MARAMAHGHLHARSAPPTTAHVAPRAGATTAAAAAAVVAAATTAAAAAAVAAPEPAPPRAKLWWSRTPVRLFRNLVLQTAPAEPLLPLQSWI